MHVEKDGVVARLYETSQILVMGKSGNGSDVAVLYDMRTGRLTHDLFGRSGGSGYGPYGSLFQTGCDLLRERGALLGDWIELGWDGMPSVLSIIKPTLSWTP